MRWKKKVLDECDNHKDSLKINLERTTTWCFVNKRKVTPIAYDKQNFCTRPIKSFLFFSISFEKIKYNIPYHLKLLLHSSLYIHSSRIFHIPSLAPLEYNIKVKGSCPYFCSYFISRKVTRVGCNFSFFHTPSVCLALFLLAHWITALIPPFSHLFRSPLGYIQILVRRAQKPIVEVFIFYVGMIVPFYIFKSCSK